MAKKKYLYGFRTNITFRDVYSNCYHVEVFSTSLVKSAYLNRLVRSQLEYLPNNRVIRSSISLFSEAVRLDRRSVSLTSIDYV